MTKDNKFTYRGFTGVIDTIDADLGLISGTVLGIRDVIHFEGKTVAETLRSFRKAVDAYLKLCEQENVPPQKPKSGTFNVRVDPSLHQRIEVAAQAAGLSLNAWIATHLQQDADEELGQTG